MLISSCDFKICFFHAPIIALNKFGSRSNTRAWWRPYWFWSFSCFLQDFNYSASCTLGKKIGGTVCKPAPLQPWFRCMPPVHLDHQSQALHLDLLGSSNPSSKHRSISKVPSRPAGLAQLPAGASLVYCRRRRRRRLSRILISPAAVFHFIHLGLGWYPMLGSISSPPHPPVWSAAAAVFRSADLVCLRLCMIIAVGEWRYDLFLVICSLLDAVSIDSLACGRLTAE